VLLHGYLLQGTGSNIYVANIAKAWQNQGHGVSVVCQDRKIGKQLRRISVEKFSWDGISKRLLN